MDKRKTKKLLILNLPYFLVGLFATNLGEAWRLAEGADSSAKILSFFNALPIALNNPLPSFHPLDLLIGILCGAGLRLAVYLKGKNAKKYRHNVEYGSARWGTAKDIEPFIAQKFEDNVILTKTERLMMSNRPKNPANARNKNVLIIGGSGSGKTRFWLKPNLLQMHSSYVVTDPKGSIVIECGNALLKHGYTIKIFNTINFQKSMHYNPFAYIHSEKDILKLVTTLIANTKGDGKAGDEFWTKAETLLYCALIGYIHYEAPVEEQNFSTLIEFLNAMEVREDDEEFQNPVDLMFEALEKKKPNHFAVRQYKKYKLAAGKTAKSILISCGARLAPFDIQEVRDVTAYDELQLDTLGDKKTALFLIMSDIIGADNDYKALEAALRNKINNIERTHSGYDEYRYDLDEINHNPYELAAYLTVKFEDYTRDEVQATLQWLFEQQYELTLTEVVEIRTRTTSSTDPETGETTTEEEDYEYYILNVKLRNKGLNSVISNSGLSEDDMERYRILLQTRGNRPDIFGNDIYATPGGEYTDYDIPGEALTDTRFANMIREAEKYLGYPYVWGGSSPSTSFDCSGFVSYVINHCGNGWSVGRLTANGLMGVCDIIPKSSAKPGDLIFFQGTYDTSGASHVGIYVGNGMMIHCGNPISYASIESNYWQQHFYCFGRIRN